MIIQKELVFLLVLIKKTVQYSANIIDDNHSINLPKQDPICRDFIIPQSISDISIDKEYSLQSPKYPDFYPISVDCVFIIKAPSPSWTIHLEFRETFDIEYSANCFNDFLQINDGPFGFSKEISKYCGKEIAKEIIQSSGNYLWLRFYSDKTETGRGFKLIYRFINSKENSQPTKICYRKLTIPNSHSALLNSSNLKKYQLNNNFKGIEECVFDISVSKESNIYIVMTQLNSTVMGTLGQFIEIYDRITGSVVVSKNKNYFLINENSLFEKVFLKHQRAVIRIKFKQINSIMAFQFVMTALVKKSNENCSLGEFKCEGSFCISKKLVCNNLRNCPSGDDEVCDYENSNQHSRSTFVSTTTETNEENDHYRLHGFILGAISLLLICMLIGCIIHSIEQSRKLSKTAKRTVRLSDTQNIRNTILRFEDKPLKSSIPSTATLTTDVLCKKQLIQSKPKQPSIKLSKSEKEPISIFYRDFTYTDNVEPHSSTYYPSRDSCSPECEKMSKSISNINQFIYHGPNEHLPGCTSLPNFSTESVKNLFEDEDYPVIEEVTICKPIRMKYYA